MLHWSCCDKTNYFSLTKERHIPELMKWTTGAQQPKQFPRISRIMEGSRVPLLVVQHKMPRMKMSHAIYHKWKKKKTKIVAKKKKEKDQKLLQCWAMHPAPLWRRMRPPVTSSEKTTGSRRHKKETMQKNARCSARLSLFSSPIQNRTSAIDHQKASREHSKLKTRSKTQIANQELLITLGQANIYTYK